MADPVTTLQDLFSRTLAPQRVCCIGRPFASLRASRIYHTLVLCCRLQEVIQQAEAELKALSGQPGYSITLLQVGICQIHDAG